MSDEKAKPMGKDAVVALGLLAAMSGYSDTPRQPEPSECERCHQKGFHASLCWYVTYGAFLEHYRHGCKACKPGLDIDGPGVLCPRGLRLWNKAKDVPSES